MTDEPDQDTPPEPILGTVVPPRLGTLVTPWFTGDAGCRDLGDGMLELAYLGEIPRKWDISDPVTFDGEPVRIATMGRGLNKAFTVLTVELVKP